MLGAAEVAGVVVVSVVVVVGVVVPVAPVVSVLPGTVAACGCCGTKALIVRDACTCGKVVETADELLELVDEEVHDDAGTSQNAMSLTSKSRPYVWRRP